MDEARQFSALNFQFLGPVFAIELLLAQAFFLVNQVFKLAIDERLALDEPLFRFGGGATAGGDGFFGLFPNLESLFVGLKPGFAGYVVGLAAGALARSRFIGVFLAMAFDTAI